jgi:hypothetical protein
MSPATWFPLLLRHLQARPPAKKAPRPRKNNPRSNSMNIPSHIQRAGREAVETYKKALPHGERWAEMCALQVAPGTKGTDRTFMEGRMNNQQLDEMPRQSAAWMVKEAKAAGINISGKYYCGGIADKRAWKDPEAWVSSSDDVMRVAQKRRLVVKGSVQYDPGSVDPPKRKLMNEKILRREVAQEMKRSPGAKAGEVRERILEKHAYRPKGR